MRKIIDLFLEKKLARRLNILELFGIILIVMLVLFGFYWLTIGVGYIYSWNKESSFAFQLDPLNLLWSIVLGILSLVFVLQQNKISEQQKEISIKQTEIAKKSNRLAKLALEQNPPLIKLVNYVDLNEDEQKPKIILGIQNVGNSIAKNVIGFASNYRSKNQLPKIQELNSITLNPQQEYYFSINDILAGDGVVSILILYKNHLTDHVYYFGANIEFKGDYKIKILPPGITSNKNDIQPISKTTFDKVMTHVSKNPYDNEILTNYSYFVQEFLE